ncbi:MAG: nucleotidyltransferase family protein [candidate division Zixibacteria bacterium]|nr:nucleotidyltransferase family protein [candidate division Zixibacteria bacterium]
MIAGLILAAGQGKRLGQVKPLLTHDHATLLRMVVERMRASALDHLIVVLGHEASKIVQKISIGGLKIVINGEHRMGLSSSLQRGLARMPPRCQAVMVALADMPLVTTATINTLISEYNKGKKGIVVPVYNHQRGHPVIIDLKYLEFLLALRGDVGAKSVLEAHPKDVHEVPIDSDEVLIDVDTREQWNLVKQRLAGAEAVPAMK